MPNEGVQSIGGGNRARFIIIIISNGNNGNPVTLQRTRLKMITTRVNELKYVYR